MDFLHHNRGPYWPLFQPQFRPLQPFQFATLELSEFTTAALLTHYICNQHVVICLGLTPCKNEPIFVILKVHHLI